MINIVRNIIEIHVSSIISNDNSSVKGQTYYKIQDSLKILSFQVFTFTLLW